MWCYMTNAVYIITTVFLADPASFTFSKSFGLWHPVQHDKLNFGVTELEEVPFQLETNITCQVTLWTLLSSAKKRGFISRGDAGSHGSDCCTEGFCTEYNSNRPSKGAYF